MLFTFALSVSTKKKQIYFRTQYVDDFNGMSRYTDHRKKARRG